MIRHVVIEPAVASISEHAVTEHSSPVAERVEARLRVLFYKTRLLLSSKYRRAKRRNAHQPLVKAQKFALQSEPA